MSDRDSSNPLDGKNPNAPQPEEQTSEETEHFVPGAELPQAFGRYEVRRLLGKGGFGEVYIGYDTRLQRDVAIKVPRYATGEDEDLLGEARRLAQLKHPGIVAVHDFGIQNGKCYIVSDYVDGVGLNQWLIDHQPDWQQAASITAAVAEALAHAHAQSVVHRDVKPGNIILTKDLLPVLVDFGLGLTDAEVTAPNREKTSGTPSYMSPEQVSGRAHRIDGRTDIYSLGVVLYRLLCGKLPFRSPNVVELIRQVCEDEPQPPRQLDSKIPVDLERVCLKALSKSMSRRYTTAADMAVDLRRIVASHTAETSATPGSMPLSASPQSGQSAAYEETPSAIRRARETERRQVTLVYLDCDLNASEDDPEGLDMEEQHEILNDYRVFCQEAVERFGGTVVQSTGHGFLT